MSVVTTLKFTVYADSHDELIETAEHRISDFFQINIEDVKSKFNYEVNVVENLDMSADNEYEATIIVRGRDV
jgi:hypothetical protein